MEKGEEKKMSLKEVHKNLLKIKETSSTNAKLLLLTEMLKNDAFRCVIQLAYDSTKHYHINKLPPKINIKKGLLSPASSGDNDRLFAFLEKLSLQKGTSNEDKRELCKLASMDQETWEITKMIVNKDMKAGFSGKTINKAYPNLLFLIPYMRCSTEKKMGNIDFERGAIGQEKADGAFCNVLIDAKGGAKLKSRNGKEFHQVNHLNSFLHNTPSGYRDTVYMGELLIMINGKILPRKTGNGILNSCIQNTADPNLARQAIIKLWDAVPYKDFVAGHSKIAYKYRLGRVSKYVKMMNNNLYLSKIQSKLLKSEEEARKFYRRLRNEKKEGAIIKNQWAKWKDHTSPDCIKLKNVQDIELRVVSWRYGKEDTQYSDVMGSVQLESDDGKIKVSVSGFTEEERNEDWDARIGKIGSLEFDELISDKSRPGIFSLYLPRNFEMRPERNDTDTLQDAQRR